MTDHDRINYSSEEEHAEEKAIFETQIAAEFGPESLQPDDEEEESQ